MSLTGDIGTTHVLFELVVCVVGLLFVGMWVCHELGRRYGLRKLRRDPEATRMGTGVVEAAVFGLMGLLLAFAFAGAASRLETRQRMIVQEANAIGTAWLRLDILSSDSQAHLRDKFRLYVDARIAMFESLPDLHAARMEDEKATQLQGEIWSAATAACTAAGRQEVTLLVLPALNEMFDSSTARTASTKVHMPLAIMILLFAVSLLSATLTGHAGAGRPRHLLHTAVFTMAVTITIYVIVDLEYPRVGLIRETASDQVMVQLRQSMK